MAEWLGEMITLLIMALALGMDAFSVGLGMGMFQIRLKQIAKIGLMIGFFHVWMPLIGMLTGKFLSERFGELTILFGGILLFLLGLHMFWSSVRKKQEKSIIAPIGLGLIIFSFSVSLDSFSVGLSLGIIGAKTILVLIFFGVGACLLTWLGLLLGRTAQDWFGKYSLALGGSILMAFGIKLILI